GSVRDSAALAARCEKYGGSGRQPPLDRMSRHAEGPGLLVVSGASGAGRSSLRAGALPAELPAGPPGQELAGVMIHRGRVGCRAWLAHGCAVRQAKVMASPALSS